jgi:cysteine synthase
MRARLWATSRRRQLGNVVLLRDSAAYRTARVPRRSGSYLHGSSAVPNVKNYRKEASTHKHYASVVMIICERMTRRSVTACSGDTVAAQEIQHEFLGS